MSSQPHVLEVCGLCKSYSRHQVLHELSFSLTAGEWAVLLGPNGAGKTTLLQLCTGLFHPDRGQVRVQGFDMQSQTALALAHLGVVFQQQALDLDLSVRANLLYHAALHGLPRREAEQRIQSLLEPMGMLGQLRTTTRKLSGGNRRKVELARALLHRPRLLLMDEASAGLDLASREFILQWVERLCREQGIAVLWTTHLIEEARRGDRLLLLNHGRLVYDGAMNEFAAIAPGGDFRAEVMRKLELA
jgi:ABC-type multidrug transport system, ATPase component